MSKMSTAVIIVLVAAGGGWLWYSSSSVPMNIQPSQQAQQEQGQEQVATSTPVQATPATPPEETSAVAAPVKRPPGYTMAQVQTHNSASTCWSVIDGNVYDLTAWIGRHPGGKEAIVSMCGKDASAAFHDQHGTKRKEMELLATMRLDILAQ